MAITIETLLHIVVIGQILLGRLIVRHELEKEVGF